MNTNYHPVSGDAAAYVDHWNYLTEHYPNALGGLFYYKENTGSSIEEKLMYSYTLPDDILIPLEFSEIVIRMGANPERIPLPKRER